jgi:hypothetical protein
MCKLFSLFLLSSSVYASPVTELNKIGTGEMSYLFWTIYKASYYVGTGEKPLAESNLTQEKPKEVKALEIEYFKSIKSDALIRATIDQWQHLGYKENDINQWATPLINIWPNVEPGNTLTLLIGDSGHSQFYFNNRLIGTIETETFGPAFLSIWLSESTSEPELRLQLLGMTQ